MTKRFTNQEFSELRDWLLAQLADAGSRREPVAFEVPDPDSGSGLYAGETYELQSEPVVHRGYKLWVDLAESLGCRLLTPRGIGREGGEGFVTLRLQPLADERSFHSDPCIDMSEKYGIDSSYARISKLEEPTFASGLEAALRRVDLQPGASVLDLGVNSGEEIGAIRRVVGAERFDTMRVVGVDHCRSAIARARERFGGPGCDFVTHDINALSSLGLGRFDLLLSIGTLHSPGIEQNKKLLMTLVQEHLTPSGAVILGFPNCRWHDGEVIYGAKAPNYNHPELSLLFKDVDFSKRYLEQHRFRVTLTGKYYVLLTATRIGLKQAAASGTRVEG